MAKYEEGLKREIVKRYLAGSAGYKALGKEFGIDPRAISRWVHRYHHHGDTGLQKKHGKYDARFKLSVLKRMWQDELSYTQVAALFDLRVSTAVISSWERLYHGGGLAALESKPKGRRKTMTTPQSPTPPAESASEDTRTLKEVLKENEYLRAEVAYLKKLKALIQAKETAAQKKRR